MTSAVFMVPTLAGPCRATAPRPEISTPDVRRAPESGAVGVQVGEEALDVHRVTEVETLADVAAAVGQRAGGRRVLDALADHPQPQRMGQRDGVPDDRGGGPVAQVD